MTAIAAETQVLTSPFTPAPLKKAFDGMLQSGYNPRTAEQSRALVIADPKVGKSTFLRSIRSAIVLDFEGGSNATACPRAYYADLSGQVKTGESPLSRFDRLRAILVDDAKTTQPQFSTVVVDTIDALVDRYAALILPQHKDGRAGWGEIQTTLMNSLEELAQAGYGVYLGAHLKTTVLSEDGNNRMYTELAIPASIRTRIIRWVDQIIVLTPKIDTIYPEKTIKLPDGKVQKIQDKTQPQRITRVFLDARSMGQNTPTGARVAVNNLLIPEQDGFDVYKAAYDQEVERVKASLG